MKISDAIVGAMLALAGVLLTLISHHISEWIRSSRDRRQSERQRELSLKHDNYLPLIQAIAEGITLYNSIPGAHHSKLSELTLSKESRNAFATKDLIANSAVMSAVITAAKQFGEGMIRLMTVKMDEVKLSIDLENIATRINELKAENRLIIDHMRALREASVLKQETAMALDSEFNSNNSILQGLFIEQKEKMDKKHAILRELHIQMVKEISGLTAVSANTVIEMRRDLNIPTDEKSIVANSRESIKILESSLPGFIDEVWHKVNSKEMANNATAPDRVGE